MGQLKNLDMEEIADPFDKGWVANSRFISQLDNPYPKDTNEHKMYERAYRRGQDDKREEAKDNSDD